MSGLEKFDSGLQAIFTSYRDVQKLGAANVGRVHPAVARGTDIYLYLTYEPPLAPIEALGFKLVSHQSADRVLGLVRLRDLETLADHPAVKRLETGQSARLRLDKSIPDIHVNEVRTQNAGGGFSGITGRDVIIGIIDSGLDFRHPDFQALLGGSRVLRIWDQGLKPQALGQSPDENLIDGPPSYGVEYKQEDLSAEIDLGANAPMHGNVYTYDCVPHGTHVASIAAGNGREGNYKYAGVAPDADIIAVKYLHLTDEATDAQGHSVLAEKRFRDAVLYILKTAAQLGKPVVINMSMGYSLGPHDGLTKDERFLEEQFPPDAVGRACVVAAGNSGGMGLHAEVSVAGGSTKISVPMVLVDERGEKRTSGESCKDRDNTEEAEAQFWYPGDPTVSVAVEPPGEPQTPFIGLGASHEVAIGGRKKLEISHKSDDVKVGEQTIKRCVISVTIRPDGNRHHTGIYKIVLQSVGAVKIEAWGDTLGDLQAFRFATMLQDGIDMPPEAPLVPDHRIAAYGGSKGVIAVAAYSSEDSLDSPLHSIADFSSQGDLLDYSFASPPPDKPDLAAPGIAIDAAKSGKSCRWNWANLGLKDYGYMSLQGTSMASPHVAGTVALMLSIKKTLTFGKIREILRENADKPDDLDDEFKVAQFKREFGAGRLNVKRVIAAVQALP